MEEREETVHFLFFIVRPLMGALNLRWDTSGIEDQLICAN